MSRIKRRVLSACGVLLAAATLGSATAPAASAATVCYSGYVCAYNDYFSGAMQSYGAAYGGRFVGFDRMKTTLVNNYTNRAVWSWNGGWSCLNPGGSLWWGSTAIYIGDSWSRC